MQRAVSHLSDSTTSRPPTSTGADPMPRRKKKGPPKEGDGRGYEVGYGRPPTHSQYRPGQSGYPAGRPKGVRNLKTDVMRILRIPVKIKEGGRSRTKSTQEGILLVLREKALR